MSSSMEWITRAGVLIDGMRRMTTAFIRCSSRTVMPSMVNSPASLLWPAFIWRSTMARRRSFLMPYGGFSSERQLVNAPAVVAQGRRVHQQPGDLARVLGGHVHGHHRTHGQTTDENLFVALFHCHERLAYAF